MKKTELVIMAAGMGSRFGGLKQIEPFGPHGEALLDFSLYDAREAGFDKAIIVIRKAIEKDFKEICGSRLERIMDVEYAFQETDRLPLGFEPPKERVKPWGTGHAVLCAGDKISAPFAVINADDYYGRGAYEAIHRQIAESDDMCMIGYRLGNTITENGTVARGICDVKDGYLRSITERTEIDKNSGIPLNTTVSMNMWGFDIGMLDYLEKKFRLFLEDHITDSKAEFFLPAVVSSRIAEENKRVKVINTDEKWYGITYKEDAETVRSAMEKYIKEEKYRL